MTDTDREMDIFIEEIKAENERLIRDYLLYVMRPRDLEPQPEPEQQPLLAPQAEI